MSVKLVICCVLIASTFAMTQKEKAFSKINEMKEKYGDNKCFLNWASNNKGRLNDIMIAYKITESKLMVLEMLYKQVAMRVDKKQAMASSQGFYPFVLTFYTRATVHVMRGNKKGRGT